jgi:HK97 family phage portal protein
MILSRAINRIVDVVTKPTWTRPELVSNFGLTSASGQKVTVENSNNVSTAYRCVNILSDDIGKIPLQTFVSRRPGEIERLRANAIQQNIAWRLEKKPNRWQTPFQFKKRSVMWLLHWGNSYTWRPPRSGNELFTLASNVTYPVLDLNGELWYKTRFPGSPVDEYIPGVEVLHLLINPDETGLNGRGVIQYARDTIGRQMAAHSSQDSLFKRGLSAGGILWLNGEGSKEIRDTVREAYEEKMSGVENNSRIVILDEKVSKFEQITMRPTDVQFLQSIQQNDAEIANYFGLPLHKLNMGKQSYESNSQQQLDYLSTTLDPYLVQWEEAAALKWLTNAEQESTYFRFERSVLLRTDPKSRGEYLNGAINNGRLTPNESRQIEDRPASDDPAANFLYMPVNIQPMSVFNNPSQGDPNDQ